MLQLLGHLLVEHQIRRGGSGVHERLASAVCIAAAIVAEDLRLPGRCSTNRQRRPTVCLKNEARFWWMACSVAVSRTTP